jgi:hypothetical protein
MTRRAIDPTVHTAYVVSIWHDGGTALCSIATTSGVLYVYSDRSSDYYYGVLCRNKST